MSENAIRDQLVTRLELIEPGLAFVAKEYYLRNDVGSSGKVDILARDATGCFVLVELKRSDVAARQALHELAKYVELFQRNSGRGSADVRAVIVYTEWRELLAPFSQAAREWSVNLRGYRLALDVDDVTPVAAQAVRPLAEAPLVAPTPIQLLIQNRYGDLDVVWRWAARRLADIGVEHLLGFDIRHPIHLDGLYLVIGRIDPDSGQAIELSRVAEERHYDLSDAPDGYQLEYAALYHLCQEYAGFVVEDVTPHSLSSLLKDPAWRLTSVRRTGAFQDELVFPDADLISDSSATGGLSDVQFHGVARTDHRQRWDRFVCRVQLSLAGNEPWLIAATGWLEEIAANGEPTEVTASIFNPCDLVSAFTFGWPDRLAEFLPLMELVARAEGQQRVLSGVLVSARTYRSVFVAFEQVYGDPQAWAIERICGDVWKSDREFVRELGLRYAAFEHRVEFPHGAVLEYEDNDLVRRLPQKMVDGQPYWYDSEPLPALLSKHAHEFEQFALMLQLHVQRPG